MDYGFCGICPAGGIRFHALRCVDNYTREWQTLEVDVALTGRKVVGALERVAKGTVYHQMIIVDNGSEFTSKAFDTLAYCSWGQTRFHSTRQTRGECDD